MHIYADEGFKVTQRIKNAPVETETFWFLVSDRQFYFASLYGILFPPSTFRPTRNSKSRN